MCPHQLSKNTNCLLPSTWCQWLEHPLPTIYLLFCLSCTNPFFNIIHSISHPSIKWSIKMIKARYYWPNMDKIFKNFAHHANKQKSLIQTLEIPSARFHTVHINIVGPLPLTKSLNNPYLSPYRYVPCALIT